MSLEEIKAAASRNPYFQPGYVEDVEEEKKYSGKYTGTIDDDVNLWMCNCE